MAKHENAKKEAVIKKKELSIVSNKYTENKQINKQNPLGLHTF